LSSLLRHEVSERQGKKAPRTSRAKVAKESMVKSEAPNSKIETNSNDQQNTNFQTNSIRTHSFGFSGFEIDRFFEFVSDFVLRISVFALRRKERNG
jgi:hypothetical protein